MRSAFRSLAVWTLSFSVNLTACSGIAMAADLVEPFQQVASPAALMSVAETEPSCLGNRTEDALTQEHAPSGGCQDATACIQSTASADTERIQLAFAHAAEIIPAHVAFRAPAVSDTASLPTLYARAGPLYEHSSFIAHTLLKRE